MFSSVFTRNNYNLLSEMVRTDFKLRYQGSVLGYLWSFLKPLLLFAVLYTVFTRFLRFGGDPRSLLLGIVLWNFFIEATSVSLVSVVARGDLIRKISMPKYLIILSSTASALINLLLNLVVVFIFLLFADNNIGLESLLFIPILLELYVLVLALSFILGALYVRFRDINYIWEVTLQMLFFATPILYPLTLIPNETVRQVLLLNPLAQIIQDARQLLTADAVQVYDIVSWPLALIPFALVLLTTAIAVFFFRKSQNMFAEDI